MWRTIIFISLFSCLGTTLWGQQQPVIPLLPVYPSWYNPGATAYHLGTTLSLGYRDQWNINDAPTSQLIAFDYRPNRSSPLGYGATLARETSGLDNMFSFQARAAAHFGAEQDGHHFSLGMSIGLINRSRNYANIILEDYRDKELLIEETLNQLKPDAGIGLHYRYEAPNNAYFKIDLAANRLPGMFDDQVFQFDQLPHLYTNIQLGIAASSDLMIEPSVQYISILSPDYRQGRGQLSFMLGASYQNKFWGGLYGRPGEIGNTFGLFVGLSFDRTKYGINIGYDVHSQLGGNKEIAGYYNIAAEARCVNDVRYRDPYWEGATEFSRYLRPFFENDGLSIDDLEIEIPTGPYKFIFALSEENETEINWKYNADNENRVRLICSKAINDMLNICNEPHLEEVTKVILTYSTPMTSKQLEESSQLKYEEDSNLGEGLNLVGKVNGETKRRTIYIRDNLTYTEFYLAKLYSLQERILYRLSGLGLDKSQIELRIDTDSSSDHPYKIEFRMR